MFAFDCAQYLHSQLVAKAPFKTQSCLSPFSINPIPTMMSTTNFQNQAVAAPAPHSSYADYLDPATKMATRLQSRISSKRPPTLKLPRWSDTNQMSSDDDEEESRNTKVLHWIKNALPGWSDDDEEESRNTKVMHWIKDALQLVSTQKNVSMSSATRTFRVDSDPEIQMGFSTTDSFHSTWPVFEKENQNWQQVMLSSTNSEAPSQATVIEIPNFLDATQQLLQGPPSTASQSHSQTTNARQGFGDVRVDMPCALPGTQHRFAASQIRRSAELEC